MKRTLSSMTLALLSTIATLSSAQTATHMADYNTIPLPREINEAMWVPANARSYDTFLQRLPQLTEYYDVLG